MICFSALAAARRLALPVLFFCLAARLAAASGPTLRLDYGRDDSPANPVGQFMYFVPLISPEPVFIVTNDGNTQCARIISFHCVTNGNSFTTKCEFKFLGNGFHRDVFDHSQLIERRKEQLQNGETLARQLGSINVEGAGCGCVEIEGAVSNGVRTINEVRLKFNARGHSSPVSIHLQDIRCRDGAVQFENEIVARVNELSFRRAPGTPKMEVSLASIKRKGAGDNLWQNFVGGIKGTVANMFIPPITVTAEGNQAMLDFGQALALEKRTFTFPLATRLKKTSAAP